MDKVFKRLEIHLRERGKLRSRILSSVTGMIALSMLLFLTLVDTSANSHTVFVLSLTAWILVGILSILNYRTFLPIGEEGIRITDLCLRDEIKWMFNRMTNYTRRTFVPKFMQQRWVEKSIEEWEEKKKILEKMEKKNQILTNKNKNQKRIKSTRGITKNE